MMKALTRNRSTRVRNVTEDLTRGERQKLLFLFLKKHLDFKLLLLNKLNVIFQFVALLLIYSNLATQQRSRLCLENKLQQTGLTAKIDVMADLIGLRSFGVDQFVFLVIVLTYQFFLQDLNNRLQNTSLFTFDDKIRSVIVTYNSVIFKNYPHPDVHTTTTEESLKSPSWISRFL